MNPPTPITALVLAAAAVEKNSATELTDITAPDPAITAVR